MIKRYKKPTVLVTWAFAYLAIFMVPVVLLSYVLLRSTKVITNESIGVQGVQTRLKRNVRFESK